MRSTGVVVTALLAALCVAAILWFEARSEIGPTMGSRVAVPGAPVQSSGYELPPSSPLEEPLAPVTPETVVAQAQEPVEGERFEANLALSEPLSANVDPLVVELRDLGREHEILTERLHTSTREAFEQLWQRGEYEEIDERQAEQVQAEDWLVETRPIGNGKVRRVRLSREEFPNQYRDWAQVKDLGKLIRARELAVAKAKAVSSED